MVFRLPPYFENFGKRSIKSPKLYFTDPGLLAYVLGIETPDQVRRDPLVGGLFENLVVELLKARYNEGLAANMYFYRDGHGNVIDLLLKRGRALTGVEIKSTATYNSSYKKGLEHFSGKRQTLDRAAIVYSGQARRFSDGIEALHFSNAATLAAAVSPDLADNS